MPCFLSLGVRSESGICHGYEFKEGSEIVLHQFLDFDLDF